MLRSPLAAALARRAVLRRLRRMGGTDALAWAVRVPLVTLVLAAGLLMVLPRRGGPSRR